MIGCYTLTPAVAPGAQARIQVSTTARTFGLQLIRLTAAGPRLVWRSPPCQGERVAAGAGDADWDWPGYALSVPESAVAGVHLVAAVELETYGRAHAPDLIGLDGSCLLTVLPPRPAAPLLYKLPTQTYHAYNPTGGTSLYVNHSWTDQGCVVSLRRPGCGTGGLSAEQVDVYAPGNPRQSFWHWDWPFLSWLERAGIAVDVVPDTYLDAAPELLSSYRAVVTAGHDEYWTMAQRAALEDFVGGGGSYAVFGANTCWWRCDLTDSLMRVRKDPDALGTGRDLWWRQQPENSLLALSYRNGAGWWGGMRPDTRYCVARPDDPLLAGADLQALAALGSLAGYECDGYSYSAAIDVPDGRDGCPAEFTVLAHTELGTGHWPGSGWHYEEREQAGDAPRVGAIGYVRRGRSLVFNAGTADWAMHLAAPAVDRITRNVLAALSEG
jgi:hypothetical protein